MARLPVAVVVTAALLAALTGCGDDSTTTESESAASERLDSVPEEARRAACERQLQDPTVRVFFVRDAGDAAMRAFQGGVADLEGVDGVRFVSKEAALKDLAKQLGEGGDDLTRGLPGGTSPLPDSLAVTASIDDLEAVEERVNGLADANPDLVDGVRSPAAQLQALGCEPSE